MKKLVVTLIIFSLSLSVISQVGINNTGSAPLESAMLDVSSSDKGMLVPRMSSSNRTSITSPANGLLVYDTDSSRFYYYDGGWNTVANQHQLGGSSNYAEFEDDGTLIFYGSSTTFDDLQVPGLATVKGSASPTLTNFLGSTYLYSFSNGDEVYFTVQIPHGWKEGSYIYPHVHFVSSAATSEHVEWGLEYTWASVDGSFSSPTTIYATETDPIGSNVHEVVGFGGVSGTGQKISSMMVCRLFRSTSQGQTPYYSGEVFLLQFDIHYEVNTVGSRLQWIK